MDKRLLNYDELTGLKTYHSYDDATDTTVISYDANSTPILERNKMEANATEFSKQGIKDGFWKYASIPVEVQMDWLLNHGVDVYDDGAMPKISKLLNDPDYRYLKTTNLQHRFK